MSLIYMHICLWDSKDEFLSVLRFVKSSIGLFYMIDDLIDRCTEKKTLTCHVNLINMLLWVIIRVLWAWSDVDPVGDNGPLYHGVNRGKSFSIPENERSIRNHE